MQCRERQREREREKVSFREREIEKDIWRKRDRKGHLERKRYKGFIPLKKRKQKVLKCLKYLHCNGGEREREKGSFRERDIEKDI